MNIFINFFCLLCSANALIIDSSKIIKKVNIHLVSNQKQSLNIRSVLNSKHKKFKKRFRSPRLELDNFYEEDEFFYDDEQDINEEQVWFITPLSTPSVLSTLTQWLHEYDQNSTEATSLMEMMGWQEMVAIKDRPGFHLSIGLCSENKIRAIAQFQSVHNDKKNLLLITNEEELFEVQPLTVRAIATSANEDFAIDMLLDIFSTVNSGPFVLNGKNVEITNKPYINFNWNRLKFVHKWFLDTLYKCMD